MDLSLSLILTHHLPPVLCREEHPPGPAVEVVVVEADPADRWSVDDGRHLLKVAEEDFVEQRLVAVLERLKQAPPEP